MLHYDKIYRYAKNLEQDKYQNLLEVVDDMSEKAGYDIMEVSNDKIIPINDLGYEDNQKLVIFDDYVEKFRIKSLIILFRADIKIVLSYI